MKCVISFHFILIYLFRIRPKIYKKDNEIVFAKEIKSKPDVAYLSMEWQAKALCGELMIPYNQLKNDDLINIINKTNSSYSSKIFYRCCCGREYMKMKIKQ